MTEDSVAQFGTWLSNNGFNSAYSGRLGEGTGAYYLQRGEKNGKPAVRVFTRDGDGWALEGEETFESRSASLEEYRILCSGKSHVLNFLGEK